MLRFNWFRFKKIIFIISFQYILCYGSTLISVRPAVFRIYFNTSYVTVQQWAKKQVQKRMSISIHLMLRFNKSHQKQYNNYFFYFNTSYVTVQHGIYKRIRSIRRISIHLMLRFNNNFLG